MLATLSHDLCVGKVEHNGPEPILSKDYEGEEVRDLQLVSHREADPPLVNGGSPTNLPELHLPAATGSRREKDLRWDGVYLLIEGLGVSEVTSSQVQKSPYISGLDLRPHGSAQHSLAFPDVSWRQ